MRASRPNAPGLPGKAVQKSESAGFVAVDARCLRVPALHVPHSSLSPRQRTTCPGLDTTPDLANETDTVEAASNVATTASGPDGVCTSAPPTHAALRGGQVQLDDFDQVTADIVERSCRLRRECKDDGAFDGGDNQGRQRASVVTIGAGSD